MEKTLILGGIGGRRRRGRQKMRWLDGILKAIIGRTDAEAEAPILWPPDAKS